MQCYNRVVNLHYYLHFSNKQKLKYHYYSVLTQGVLTVPWQLKMNISMSEQWPRITGMRNIWHLQDVLNIFVL